MVHESLERLAGMDPRQAQVVELRFFAGLSVEETAVALDISPQSVMRDWTLAKAWLQREVRGANASSSASHGPR
jgi:RNA polymerase sigma-70 factor, ECF subfamily